MRTERCTAFMEGIFLGAILMFFAMAMCVVAFDVQKSDAIKHGAAYYHPETGEFTWKGEEE